MQRNKLELLQKIMRMDADQLLILAMELYEEQDELMQVKCYQRAAKLGSAEAQYCLGSIYETGMGVIRNEEEAVYWYIKAAIKRHTDAMSVLANYYYYGTVVEQNDDTARMLLLLSTDSRYTEEKLNDWFGIKIAELDATAYQEAEACWKKFMKELRGKVDFFIEG